MMPRCLRPALAAVLVTLAVPAAAAAAVPQLPLSLPGAARSARASAGAWIVGGRPGRTTARLARASGARRIGAVAPGSYVVPTARARALAHALAARGDLVYAQPDVHRAVAAATPFPLDPLDDLAGYRWRDHVVSPALAAPRRTRLIALVDATLDASHPEFASGRVTTTGGHPVRMAHGTATASVAAAPRNGIGLTGLWPGARALNVALDDNISCSDSARGIVTAIRRGASVINMSYGSSDLCVPEYLALEAAVGRGIVPVAAAGNELADGNPVEFPATLPHVVTVGALDRRDRPSTFSNANAAVDLSAPGVCIPTAVPAALTPEDTGCPAAPQGYAYQSGTSFAAPMVAAAIAWVRAARPGLQADQAANVVRFSARDVGPSGYDAETGYGELSVDRALALRAGPHDPGEPNDGPSLVDGTLLGTKQRLLSSGRRTVHVDATVDVTEDPADWYRIAVPAYRVAHVAVRPRAGNPDLLVRRARGRSYPRVARSEHRGARTERLTLVNATGAREIRYLGVTPGAGRRYDASYRLTVSP